MTYLSTLLPVIYGVVPPIVSVVALLLTGGLKLKDIRGSTFNRIRILTEVAEYDNEFNSFIDLLWLSYKEKYSETIELFPICTSFLFVTYLSLKYDLTSPILFILTVFFTLGALFLMTSLVNSFRPRFIQRISPNISVNSGIQTYDGNRGRDLEEVGWLMNKRSSYIYTLIRGLLNMPYGVVALVIARVLWDTLLFSALWKYSSYVNEFIYSVIVFFSTLVFLMAYGNIKGRLLSDIEDMIFMRYKTQTKIEVEPEIEVIISSTRGTIFNKKGKLRRIGLEMVVEDNEGFINNFHWKDIIHIATRRR